VDAQVSWRPDAGGELRGRYRFGHIVGGGGFEYLDGRQQRLSVEAGFTLASALLRAGYELELNHRRDLQQGSEFFSASPTRQSLFASVALRNLAGWQADARGEYRVSRYGDPNLIDEGPPLGILEVTRKASRNRRGSPRPLPRADPVRPRERGRGLPPSILRQRFRAREPLVGSGNPVRVPRSRHRRARHLPEEIPAHSVGTAARPHRRGH